jgi:hypothetical protein
MENVEAGCEKYARDPGQHRASIPVENAQEQRQCWAFPHKIEAFEQNCRLGGPSSKHVQSQRDVENIMVLVFCFLGLSLSLPPPFGSPFPFGSSLSSVLPTAFIAVLLSFSLPRLCTIGVFYFFSELFSSFFVSFIVVSFFFVAFFFVSFFYVLLALLPLLLPCFATVSPFAPN